MNAYIQYTLSLQCNWIDSQRTFLEQFTSGVTKVALIGCGCSLATEPVAVSSNFWNVTHVSILKITLIEGVL